MQSNALYIRVITVVLLVFVLSAVALAGHKSLTPTEAVSMKSAIQKPASSFAIQFDLSELGKGQRVDMAILKLTFDADENLGEGIEIQVYVADESWEGQVLARQSPITVVDELMTASHSESGEEKYAEFHVTEIVQMWYDGTVPNNGFVLRVRGNEDSKFEVANRAGSWGVSLDVSFSKDE